MHPVGVTINYKKNYHITDVDPSLFLEFFKILGKHRPQWVLLVFQIWKKLQHEKVISMWRNIFVILCEGEEEQVDGSLSKNQALII